MAEKIDHTYVYRVPMPDAVHEAVTPGYDDTYTVYINEKLDQDAARAAYEHARRHIDRDDFDQVDVQSIESGNHIL